MDFYVRKIERALPYALREKLRYYLDFVHDRLTDIALEQNKYDSIRKVRPQVELVFTLRFLHAYLIVGYQNYARMLSFFEDMEIPGFQIGSTVFDRKSSLSTSWSDLSLELGKFLSEPNLKAALQLEDSTDKVIRRILREND